MAENKNIESFKSEKSLKEFLAVNYIKQINNFFGDEKKSLRFLSSVMADVQRNPKLLECTPTSIINSYITMAQLGFMPSGVSGESYVLPYENSKKVGAGYVKVKEAQFQLGYQGLVTLFYKAGVTKITSGIVYEKDKVKILTGKIEHEVDPRLSKKERGEPIGAYVIVTFNGEENAKYMNMKDIIDHAKKFSKSYDPIGKYSPWNPANDPELTMPMKTVLKQHSKLLPKNESINQALDADNRDSVMYDRIEEAKGSSKGMTMGNLLTNNEKDNKTEENQDGVTDAEGDQSQTNKEPVVDIK